MVIWNWAIEAYIGGAWVDISGDVKWQKVITVKRGLTGSSVNDRVAPPGRFSFTLNNGESNSAGLLGYYSPNHVNVRSGFALGMRVRLKLTSGATTRYVFHGYTVSILPSVGKFRERETQVTASDYMEQFNVHKLSRIPVQTGIRTDQIVTLVTANLPIAPLNTSYDTTPDTYAYALQDEQDENTYAITALQKSAQSDLSYIYVIGNSTNGETLRVESRNTRILNTTSLLTINDSMSGLTIEISSDNIYNNVHVPVSPVVVDAAATTVLATLPAEILLNPSETEIISMRLVDPSGAGRRISGIAYVDPFVADTHYRMSGISGNGGNDLNSFLSVAYVNKGANTVDVSITNTGAKAGYVNKLNLVGKGIYLYQSQEANALNSASIAAHGDRSFTFRIPYQSQFNIASDFANEILRRYKSPFTKVSSVFFYADANSTLMTAALTLDIGDRITMTESATAVSGDYFINGVEYTITSKRILQVSYVLELATVTQVCILDNASYALLDTNAYLAF